MREVEEKLETQEQWEFSGQEDDLRSLRHVLVEQPRRRGGSFQASFVLGGLIGLLGVGAFFFADSILPSTESLIASIPEEDRVRPTPAPAPVPETAVAEAEVPRPAEPAVAEAEAPRPAEPSEVRTVEIAAAPVAPGLSPGPVDLAGTAPSEPAPEGVAVPAAEAPMMLAAAEPAAPGVPADLVAGPAQGPHLAPSRAVAEAKRRSSAGPEAPASPGEGLVSGGLKNSIDIIDIGEVALLGDTPSPSSAQAPRASSGGSSAAVQPHMPAIPSAMGAGENTIAMAQPSSPQAPLSGQGPFVSRPLSAPASIGSAGMAQAPRIATRAVPPEARSHDVGAIAALEAEGAERSPSAMSPRTPSVAQPSPGIPAAPGSPVPAGLSAAPVGRPVAVATPRELPLPALTPDLPRVAALQLTPGLPGSSGLAPAPGARGDAAARPGYMERMPQTGAAPVGEAAPEAVAALAAPHAPSADGAAATTIAALEFDYASSQQINANLSASREATAPAVTAPYGSKSPSAMEPRVIASMATAVAVAAPMEEGRILVSVELGGVSVADAPAEPVGAPQTPDSPILSAGRAEAPVNRDRLPMIASISLDSSTAIDADPGVAAGYAALIDAQPRFQPPATPNVTIDPSAAFSEPLDALTAAPRADAPEAPSHAALASLGAQPSDNFAPIVPPREVSLNYNEDSGRDAARKAVRSAARRAAEQPAPVVDNRPAWVRNGVAPPPNPDNLPVMAIIIDEVGSYGAKIEEITSMTPTVTVSVIPSTPKAADIVRQMRFSRREVLVHMPMETSGDAELGPRPILTGMSDLQIRETAAWHLTQFDGYIGVDTHRGKTATQDRRVMKTVADLMAPYGMLFLDSRNSSKSVAEQVAREAGMLSVGNNFFIDDKRHTSAIYRQLDAAAAYARKHGGAIAIGNPHAVTVQAVKAWMTKNDGVKVMVMPLTHVAQVMNGVKKQDIIVAGTPPPNPRPLVTLGDAARDFSEEASESISETLSGVASNLFQSLFDR